MNKKIVALFLIVVAISSFVVTVVSLKRNKNLDKPDDSSVTSNSNPQRDQAITEYLLAQESFTWNTASNSKNFCVFENLDNQKELFPIPIWINCGEFKLVDGQLQRLNGVSTPVMIDYPNELSFFDVNQFTHQSPRDGNYFLADVQAIFPSSIQAKITNFDPQNLTKKIEEMALNNLENESSKREVTLTGKLICLSHKDKTGPQTMECAYGFRDESGQDYALSDPEMKFIPTLSTDKTITINGILSSQEETKYDSQGLIEIKSVVN